MYLGKTSLAMHSIKLTDYMPFKKRYLGIPTSMYEEVWEYLKEMQEIVVFRLSYSPWASPVVLVLKKDGKLCFCIDL